jgi:ABC-type multidrug transport system fused ATPase/permease subunit
MVQLVLAPVLLISMSPLLFAIAMLPLPLIIYSFVSLQIRLKPLYRQQRETESVLNSQLQEVVTGIREIKAFNLEDRSGSNYRDVNQQLYDTQNKIMRVFSFNHQLQYGSKDWTIILIAGVGGIFVMKGIGGVTVGTILSFAALIGFMYGPINALLAFFDTYQRGMVSLERIVDFLNIQPDVKDRRDARELKKNMVHGGVEYSNVSFAYSPGIPVLSEVQFTITPGEKIAVVGPSGSGKSTLLSLLLRFYNVSEGTIRIDEHDICEYTQSSLRRHVGIVFQETFLFYGSVRDNLLYVNPSRTEADMLACCRAANILETIQRLPQGFDTMLGERGVKLSGGQRQRLAIARVFLKDPAIVILDEATSAVDTVTERLIQESIEAMLNGRTAFIIAHRLSTVKNCDRIIVMNAGSVAEIGTHDELMKKQGIYWNLHSTDQFLSTDEG